MMLGAHQRLHQLDYDPETIPFKLVVNDYEIVRKAKYLGLIVDENLTWEGHIDYICGKIKRGVGVLKQIRPHSHGIGTVLIRCISFQKPVRRGVAFTWDRYGSV